MNAVLGALVGCVMATGCLRWTRSYLLAINGDANSPKMLSPLLTVIGGATGVAVGAGLVASPAVLAVTTCLLIVQAPLDLVTHRLARAPTVLALVAMLIVRAIEIGQRSASRDLLVELSLVAALMAVVVVLHWRSPAALGWGDVLLVAPLALAVVSAGSYSLFMWLLLASSSAAVHGLVLWRRTSRRHVPFGPHLLSAAWLVLVYSV